MCTERGKRSLCITGAWTRSCHLENPPLRQLKLLWRFRRDRPDLVVVLHVNEEVNPLAYWINRDAVVPFTNLSERYVFLAAHPVKVRDTQHAVVLPLKVAQYAGGATVPPRIIYEVKADELAAIRIRFADWIDHPYVVFQTGGGRALFWRDWPVENYVTVTHWFSDRFAHKVNLTGGLENLERANAMERACPEVINLTGKTTLAETAALLCLAKLLLTTDTRIMHLGFAVDCPLVCLFHDLCPAKDYCPPGESARDVALQLKRSHPQQPLSACDMGASRVTKLKCQ